MKRQKPIIKAHDSNNFKVPILVTILIILVLILFKIFFKSVSDRQSGADVFFEPKTVNLSDGKSMPLAVMVNSHGKTVAFTRVVFTFDPAKLRLDTDFVSNPDLSNTIVKTNLDEINSIGEATLVIAANPTDKRPSGVFELVTFMVSKKEGATGNADLSLKPESMQFVDSDAKELKLNIRNAEVNL